MPLQKNWRFFLGVGREYCQWKNTLPCPPAKLSACLFPSKLAENGTKGSSINPATYTISCADLSIGHMIFAM